MEVEGDGGGLRRERRESVFYEKGNGVARRGDE